MNIIQDKTTFLLRTKKKLILLLALTLASGVMGTSSAGAAPTAPTAALTKYVSEAQSASWSLPSEFTPDSSTYVYAIAGGDDQSKFNIDSVTGTLSFVSARDFENPEDLGLGNTYQVTLSASDETSTDYVTYVVQITNSVLNPITGGTFTHEPSWSGTLTTVTTNQSPFANMTMTGGDTYTVINSTTGAITVTAGGPEGTLTLQVTATLASGETATTTVTFNRGIFQITTTSPISISENTTTVATFASKYALGTVAWSIIGGVDSTSFTIDSVSGVLTLNSDSDYEVQSSYSVEVQADDGVSTVDSLLLTVNVNNDGPVFDTDTVTIDVAENTVLVGSVDGNVTQNGPASGLTWTLSGPDAATFSIDSVTGAISFADPNGGNFEETNTFNVTVTATDTSTGLETDSIDVVINVTPNAGPVFDTDTVTLTVAENTVLVGTTGHISQVGAASGRTWTLSGVDSATFTINSSTGAISFANGTGGDFEDTNTFNITVTATDTSTGLETDSIDVVINLTDSGPVFDTDTVTIDVAENTVLVGSVDGNVTQNGPASSLTWTLSGVDSLTFSIDSVTGAISFADPNGGNFEETNTFNVTVTATDTSTGLETDSIDVVINVTPNVGPVFDTDTVTIEVAENTELVGLVGHMNSTTAVTPLTYTISGGVDSTT
ncbi:MAG: hypothetical protein F2786_06475, partial [Actinobacteria bacterium]|nr:hypothetical protein [Actinomycetota bacterium]